MLLHMPYQEDLTGDQNAVLQKAMLPSKISISLAMLTAVVVMVSEAARSSIDFTYASTINGFAGLLSGIVGLVAGSLYSATPKFDRLVSWVGAIAYIVGLVITHEWMQSF